MLCMLYFNEYSKNIRTRLDYLYLNHFNSFTKINDQANIAWLTNTRDKRNWKTFKLYNKYTTFYADYKAVPTFFLSCILVNVTMTCTIFKTGTNGEKSENNKFTA